jgi:hypothetical protein
MHAILYETRALGTMNANLREYARMEYRTEDPLWLQSRVRSVTRRKPSARSFGRRLISRLREFRRAPPLPAEPEAIPDL